MKKLVDILKTVKAKLIIIAVIIDTIIGFLTTTIDNLDNTGVNTEIVTPDSTNTSE